MKHLILTLLMGLVLLIPTLSAQCYSQDFSAVWPPEGWTMLNGGTGNDWSLNDWTPFSYSPDYCMQYVYHSYNAANAWAITPGIAMTAGNTYRIEFYQRVGSRSYWEFLKVTLGMAPTIAAQTTTLLNYTYPGLTNETYENRVSPEYNCTVSGTYYFGFKCYSNANKYYLLIDNIRIYETITGAPPAPAANIAPIPNAVSVMNNSLLQWEPGSGIVNGYRLSLGTDNPPTNMINNVDVGANLSYDPGDFAYNTAYYWKVQPYNQFGIALNCPVWSFQIGANPTVHNYPFIEDFEDCALNYGWQNVIMQGLNDWDFAPSPYQLPHQGVGMGLYSCIATPNYDRAILVTPPLDMDAGTYHYRLNLWMWRDNAMLDDDDQLKIYINATPDMEGQPSQIGIIHRIKSHTPVEPGANGWYQYQFEVIPRQVGAGNYLVFDAVSMGGFRLCIDDIEIQRFNPTAPVNVRMETSGNALRVSWDPIQEANGYNVWYSADPSLPLDPQNPVGWIKTPGSPTTDCFYEFVPAGVRKFFQVTSVW